MTSLFEHGLRLTCLKMTFFCSRLVRYVKEGSPTELLQCSLCRNSGWAIPAQLYSAGGARTVAWKNVMDAYIGHLRKEEGHRKAVS